MCRRALVAIVVLLGVLVLSDRAWARRRLIKTIEAATATDYVDMGIRLIVVEADPAGQPLVPGNTEMMRRVDEYRRGGIVKLWRDADGKPAAALVAPSRNPVTWFVSRPQLDLILHDGPAPWVLVQGSEGSGKTTVLAMWVAFRVLEHIGTQNEIGLTAPTHGRLAHAMKKIRDHWPSRWYHFNKTDKRYAFHAGPVVQMVSAAQRSADGGSPLQGFDFVAHAGDEWQDHHSLEADAIARGRAAPDMRRPDGTIAPKWYPRLLTSTFKDSTPWRDFRAAADKNTKDWHVALLLGLESPFIGSEHWERFRRGVTLREYQRRVLALDVGPERQLYYAWKRQIVNDNAKPAYGNLRPLPLNAVDVTRRELARYGKNVGLLLGHDPGKRQHVTEFLRAYEFPGERRVGADGKRLSPLVRWFVVGEVTSSECTMETHVDHVLRRVREKFSCLENDWRGSRSDASPDVVVRIDPHTNSGNEHPSRKVYTQWRAAGFTVFAAAYNSKTNQPTPLKVEDRIDLLNTLLCNVDDERRLFVLSDDGGTNPAAPELLKALETMERNEQGDAEWERKDASDRSHWPSAVAFALWTIEKPRIDDYRKRTGAAA